MSRSNIFDDSRYSEWSDIGSQEEVTYDSNTMDKLLEEVEGVDLDVDNSFIEEGIAYKLNNSEMEVMKKSIMRLGQARLYELFLKHDLFSEVDVDARVKKIVEQELKGFILERMQVLLGLKSEQQVETIQQVINPPQFNDIEVEFLKALSIKGTNGASSSGKTTPTKIEVVKKEIEQPIVKSDRLKTMSHSNSNNLNKIETKQVPIVSKQPIVQKKTNQSPKSKEVSNRLLEIAKQNKLTISEARALERDLISRKPVHELNEEELRERNSKIKTNKNKAQAIPNADALTTHYMQGAMNSPFADLAGKFMQAHGINAGQVATVSDTQYDE